MIRSHTRSSGPDLPVRGLAGDAVAQRLVVVGLPARLDVRTAGRGRGPLGLRGGRVAPGRLGRARADASQPLLEQLDDGQPFAVGVRAWVSGSSVAASGPCPGPTR